MDKNKFIWDIVTEILDNHGDAVDGISIHEHIDGNGNENRKIYYVDGYCFDLTKIEYNGSAPDEYYFYEMWQDFKTAGIDKAIEILNAYAGLKPNE